MSKVRKRVTFYDTVVETTTKTGKTKVKRVQDDFWVTTLARVSALTDHKKRIHTTSGKRYYGVVVRPTSPNINHLQVGRLRDLSEHLEQTNLASGKVGPLILPDPNLRVSEPTFVVPFGTKGRIAVLSPGKSTRQETIANWLTGVLDLAPKGKSIRFRPVVDHQAIARLVGSQGAVAVEFNIDAETSLPTDGDVPLLAAVEEVRTEGPSMGTITIGWSLGRDGGTINDRNIIKSLAMKIATGNFARRAKVNMILEDEDGNLHREEHNLLEDQIVAKVSYDVEADTQTSAEVVLQAVADAIKTFNQNASV